MQDAVLVDMAAKVRPGVDVLFLDTGYHFAETIGTRDAVSEVYDINVINVTPEHSVAEQDALLGKNLFAREPNECCRMRKVGTAGQGAAGLLGVGHRNPPRRGADARQRAADQLRRGVRPGEGQPVGRMDRRGHPGLHRQPMTCLVNPLVFDGYPSIGCAPCTAKPVDGADPRSGRWQGTGKIECGLHAE